MAEKRGGLTGRTGRRVIVEVSKDGFATAASPTKPLGNSFEVPGISNFNIGVGEAPTDTTPAFEGSFTTIGEPPVGDVNFTVVSYMPNHPAWKIIEDAHVRGESLAWKIKTQPRDIYGPSAGNVTAAIKATGEVTLTAGGVDLTAGVQRGMALKIGNDYYTIVSVDVDEATPANNKMWVSHAAVIGAGIYSILIPALQWEFTAGVKQVGSVEGGVDTAIGSSLIVTPSSRIPVPKII